MPHGFFTIERLNTSKRAGKPQWTVVEHLDAGHTLSDAINRIEQRGKAGFFRVIQTQRMIWAEKQNGRLCVDRKHAGRPETLAGAAAAFVRDGGKWPSKK
jgi:hypothetical protein